MSEVGKLVLDMKNVSTNSYKNNITSLINTTEHIKKTSIVDEPNHILKLKEKEYKDSCEGNTKKEPNYQYLADYYRKRLNKAFVKYNPMIHLSNISKLKLQYPETEKEYGIIQDDINKFIEKKKNINKRKSTIPKVDNSKTKDNIQETRNSIYTGNMTEGDQTTSFKHSQVLLPKIYGFKKNKKVEIKKKFPEKEKREKELNLMADVLKNIEHSISDKNIEKYLNNYKSIQGSEISQQEHNFFIGMDKANKLLTEIQEILHYRDKYESANLVKKKSTFESDDLIKKIEVLKRGTINEIEMYEKSTQQ